MRPCVLTEAEPWVRCQPVCILQSHGRCGMFLFKDQPRGIPLYASRKLAFTPFLGRNRGAALEVTIAIATCWRPHHTQISEVLSPLGKRISWARAGPSGPLPKST